MKKFSSLVVIGVVLLGIVFLLDSQNRDVYDIDPVLVEQFANELWALGPDRIGGFPIEGFDANLLMMAFPAIEPRDFDGVITPEGQYTYALGELNFSLNNPNRVSSAAQTLDTQGMGILMTNVAKRKGLRITDEESVRVLLDEVKKLPNGATANFEDCVDAGNPVMESYPRQCRDAAGNVHVETITDEPSEMKRLYCPQLSNRADACTQQYEPVCALVNVQCVTTPCPPIEQTYSNACEACLNSLVDSYTMGECSEE